MTVFFNFETLIKTKDGFMKKIFLSSMISSIFAFQVNAGELTQKQIAKKEKYKANRVAAQEATIPSYFICDLEKGKSELWVDLKTEKYYTHDVKKKNTSSAQNFFIFGYADYGKAADVVFSKDQNFLEDMIPNAEIKPTVKPDTYTMNFDHEDGDPWHAITSPLKLNLAQANTVTCKVIKGFKIQVTPIR